MNDDGLDFPTLNYLLGLVRADIRRHAKGIDRFQPKAGQSHDEALKALRRMVDAQDFRRGVHARVRSASRRAAAEGREEALGLT